MLAGKRRRPGDPSARSVYFALVFEDSDGADRRARAFTPFERQADEAKFAAAEQSLQIAEAFHMGDVEFEAGLVDQRIDLSGGSRPHRVDAEMDDALLGEPLGRRYVHARIVGRVGRRRERSLVVAGAKEDGPPLWNRHLGLFDRDLEVVDRDLGLWNDMAQIDTDSGNNAVLERILVDRCAFNAEMPRSVQMRAAVVGHREIHHGIAVDVSGVGECLFMGFPDAVDDRRLARIGRRAMMEFPAQVDDSHQKIPLNMPDSRDPASFVRPRKMVARDC